MTILRKLRKLRKLLKNPRAFFKDSYIIRLSEFRLKRYGAPYKPGSDEADGAYGELFRRLFRTYAPEHITDSRVYFFFGFSLWKHLLMLTYFPGARLVFFSKCRYLKIIGFEIARYPEKTLIVWSKQEPPQLRALCEATNTPIIRMEDGFIRSAGLGAQHHLPYSLIKDRSGIHFDPSVPSDLEKMLAEYDFEGDPALIERARALMERMSEAGIGKYNHVPPCDAEDIYGPKRGKRVLVIGQVEDDASIAYGSGEKIALNNDLVRLAREENPDAQIFYKPHPDVFAKKRQLRSNPAKVAHLATVLTRDISGADALKTVDHVYVMTSLVGMEALIRGVKVTCTGGPFYAGWGATDDRYTLPRRTRRLTATEIFAAAYILYPEYRCYESGALITPEEAVERIIRDREAAG